MRTWKPKKDECLTNSKDEIITFLLSFPQTFILVALSVFERPRTLAPTPQTVKCCHSSTLPEQFHRDSRTFRSYHFPSSKQWKAVVITAWLPLQSVPTSSPTSPHSVPQPLHSGNVPNPSGSQTSAHAASESNRRALLAYGRPWNNTSGLNSDSRFSVKLLSHSG